MARCMLQPAPVMSAGRILSTSSRLGLQFGGNGGKGGEGGSGGGGPGGEGGGHGNESAGTSQM